MMKTIYNNQYNILISLLKERRQQLGLTQGALASKINEDQTYVSKYENCIRRLDIIELRQICRAMDISLIDFIIDFESEIKDS